MTIVRLTKNELINFEKDIALEFNNGKIPYMTHLSGGNEDSLIDIFNEIKPGDYVFSTHRSHYHYLLAGGSKESLRDKILNGRSMFVFDRNLNFFTSSIVAGTPAIAAGVALALKKKKSKHKVWCFVGDGAEDESHFYPATRYVIGHNLPCNFIIEDNDRSVDASKSERWGTNVKMDWPSCVRRYEYTPTYPHIATGEFVDIDKKIHINEFPQPKKRTPVDITKKLETILNYKESLEYSMQSLAKNPETIFLGYNVHHGSAYGTLKNISPEKRLETPLDENLMTGLAMGLSLEGFKPVLFFERQDFLLNAADAIINHLDKIDLISEGEYQMPVIIRAVTGAKRPIYSGPTHEQDFSNTFRTAVSFPIYTPKNPSEILNAYIQANKLDGPMMIIEQKELYNSN